MKYHPYEKESFKEDYKKFVESLINKKMDSMEYDSYLKEEEIFEELKQKDVYTMTNKTHKSDSWVLVDSKALEKNEVCFTYDEGVMLIHYRLTGETYTKSKEEARKDWVSLVRQGFQEVD